MPRRPRKLVSERKGMEGSFWKERVSLASMRTKSWRPVRPEILSPFLKSGWRDSTISARPKERMTSPRATGGMYWGMSAIQTRMVGSMERYLTRARAWPSWRVGKGDSESWRSVGATRPLGRATSFHWRMVSGMGASERRVVEEGRRSKWGRKAYGLRRGRKERGGHRAGKGRRD